ncbi:hypothetical protein KHZ31_09260 [butyrate-producing bacterium]|nr:hypothetical protein [butyrate-producing bacterium]
MNGYKCDKCGRKVYVDPGEPRICDTCVQKIRIRQQETAIITKGGKKYAEKMLLHRD